jgi:hypothetical protein
MLGIATNVVVRLVVSDDVEQTRRARQLVEQPLRAQFVAADNAAFKHDEFRYSFEQYGLTGAEIRSAFAAFINGAHGAF